ncbi:MAG: iron-containing redox enzyme family protein, partial [Terriglobia bacterium]
PELWLQFGEALGLARAEITKTELWPETRELIDTFRLICRERPSAEGLTALYAYESQIPEVAESKMQGLRSFYGIGDHKALAYFQVHIQADRQHAAIEREALGRLLNPANMPAALQAAVTVLERLWEMLSGVLKRHNLPPAQNPAKL